MITVGAADTPVHARQDLPEQPDEVPLLVEDLLTVALRAGLRRVALVVYSSDEVIADAVADPLMTALESAAVDVPIAMRADGERWYCLGAGEGACAGRCPGACPPEGTPYDLARHPITLEAVVDGRLVHASRDAMRDSLVGDDPDEVDRVAAAMDAAGERLLRAEAGRPHLVQEGRWVQHRVRRFLRGRAAARQSRRRASGRRHRRRRGPRRRLGADRSRRRPAARRPVERRGAPLPARGARRAGGAPGVRRVAGGRRRARLVRGRAVPGDRARLRPGRAGRPRRWPVRCRPRPGPRSDPTRSSLFAG